MPADLWVERKSCRGGDKKIRAISNDCLHGCAVLVLCFDVLADRYYMYQW